MDLSRVHLPQAEARVTIQKIRIFVFEARKLKFSASFGISWILAKFQLIRTTLFFDTPCYKRRRASARDCMVAVTWNSTTEIGIGKVLPCNKKVMSLTPDRDNILKTWVHVVLNLMKCILQLIGLNKLKGQYAYLHTSTFSSQHFFFLRVQLYIVCMYIVFLFQILIQNAWLRTKN